MGAGSCPGMGAQMQEPRVGEKEGRVSGVQIVSAQLEEEGVAVGGTSLFTALGVGAGGLTSEGGSKPGMKAHAHVFAVSFNMGCISAMHIRSGQLRSQLHFSSSGWYTTWWPDLHFICGQVGGIGFVVSQVQVLVFRVLPLQQNVCGHVFSLGGERTWVGEVRRLQEQVLSVEL